MPRKFDTDYWRKRAEEARTTAAQIADPDGKRIMLGIADGYEQMARAAERIEVSRKILSQTERRRPI